MEKKAINPTTRARRRYFVEFGISMMLYLVVMVLSRWLLDGPLNHAGGGWQFILALLPMVPILLVFAAIVRLVRSTDEFYRRICIDSLAIAGGATALLAVAYGLIEGPRLPHLSAWWTYGTFMISWLIATFFVRRRYL